MLSPNKSPLWESFADINADFLKDEELKSKDENGMTLLHLAVLHNKYQHVLDLLLNGANSNAVDKDGNTPLHIAASQQRLDIMLLLLRYRATDPCSINKNGQTPHAILASHKECYKEIQDHLNTVPLLSPKMAKFLCSTSGCCASESDESASQNSPKKNL